MTRNVHKQLIFYSIVFLLVASYVYVSCKESAEIWIMRIIQEQNQTWRTREAEGRHRSRSNIFKFNGKNINL